jgi:hypothetical protein
VTFLWLLCVCAAGGFVAWSINWLGLSAWRRAKDAHWTERARLLFPIRENHDGAFARALSRLHEDSQIPAVFADNNYSHPSLYDRLIAAGMTPDYPRPTPPETSTWGR